MAQQVQNNRITAFDENSGYQITVTYIQHQRQHNSEQQGDEHSIQFELQYGINFYFGEISQKEVLKSSGNMCAAKLIWEMMQQCCEQEVFNKPDSMLTIRKQDDNRYIHFENNFRVTQTITQPINFDVRLELQIIDSEQTFQRIQNKFISQNQQINILKEQNRMMQVRFQDEIFKLEQRIGIQNQYINRQQQYTSSLENKQTQQAQEIEQLRTQFQRLEQILKQRSQELYGVDIIDQNYDKQG